MSLQNSRKYWVEEKELDEVEKSEKKMKCILIFETGYLRCIRNKCDCSSIHSRILRKQKIVTSLRN